MQTIPISFPLGQTWHAYRSHIKCEVKAREGIQALGFDTFLPMERRIVIRRRRKVHTESPLFVGYGFVKFDIDRDDWGPIKQADGVEDILTNNKIPVRISTPDMERLILADKLGLFDRTKMPDPYKPGTDVEIGEGAFAGFIGKVIKARSGDRVEILLNFFGSAREIVFPLLHIRANQI